MKRSQVKFDSKALYNELYERLTDEQTSRLIEYATQKILRIGRKIESYHSANHMDRTGNLLNSLCWFVSFDGEMQDSGFYREEIYHNKGLGGGSQSWLHEYLPDSAILVEGRKLANEFLAKHEGGNGKGWKVVFAILAPYWGYWERGFKMKSHFGGGTQFLKFAVMSEIFDEVRMELKPYKKVDYTITITPYSYTNNKYRGRNRRIGSRRLMNSKQYHSYLNRSKGGKRRKR